MSQVLWAEFGWTLTLPWPVVMVRILGSEILTGIIGLEREARNSAAGLRTHMLVGLAATTYCLITLEIMAQTHKDNARLDPLRMVEAVTGGVAFLAAGLIVFSKGAVRGLTTGASLWLTASVGLAIGLGFWPVAIGVTLSGLFITAVLGAIAGAHRSDPR